MSLVILEIQTRVAVFLSPPHGFHPRPLQQAVCVDKVEEHQCKREHSTNVLPSSFFAILRPTRRKNGHASGKPGKEPQLHFVHQQEQGTTAALNAAGTSTVQTGSEERFTGLT